MTERPDQPIAIPYATPASTKSIPLWTTAQKWLIRSVVSLVASGVLLGASHPWSSKGGLAILALASAVGIIAVVANGAFLVFGYAAMIAERRARWSVVVCTCLWAAAAALVWMVLH